MIFKLIKLQLISFFVGSIIVFTVEHFGSFSYMEEASTSKSNQPNEKLSFTRHIPLNAKVSSIYLTTPFDTYLTFKGGGYIVADMYGSFQKYPNKVKYYFKASLKDFKYIIYISVGFFILLLILTNYKLLKTIPSRVSNVKGKNLSPILIFLLVGLVSIGTLKYYEIERKLNFIEYENNNLEDKISDLETENEELQSKLSDFEEDYNDFEESYNFYKNYYSENNMVVYPMVEYGLLLKKNLTKFIDYDDPKETFVFGEKRVKCKIENFRDYFELKNAVQTDLLLKYTHLLNLVYDGDGLKYYYRFNPY